MRIRTIKPGFWENEELAGVSAEAALLAIGLLNYADDEGYFKANPKLIEAAIFPLRELSSNIRRLLDELSRAEFLALYEGSDGRKYGHIVNFSKHQRVDRAKPSEIKGLIKFDDDSTSDQRHVPSGREEEGEGRNDESAEQSSTQQEAVFELPTAKNAETYPITQSDLDQWSEDFPNVQVSQEIHRMRSWLDANRRKRKTKQGMRRFIVNWLSRQQDRPATSGGSVAQVSLEDIAR